MTYNVSSRILTDDNGKKYKLSRLRHRFLICLSSGNVVTPEEVAEFVDNYTSLYRLKCDFCKRFPVKIDNVRGVGYILKSEIYFY